MIDLESTPTELHARNTNYLEPYLSQDNLSIRDSDDTTVEVPEIIHVHHSHHSNGLARQESKKTYVDFVHGDKENPLNFSKPKKWFITVLAVVMTMLCAVAAGAYPVVTPDLIKEFGVSREIATLGTSLYPLGCMCLSSETMELILV